MLGFVAGFLKRGTVAAGLMVASSLLTSCASTDKLLFEGVEAQNSAEAGTTQISVLAVYPWEDIAPDLMPDFDVAALKDDSGAQSALKQVLPTTSLFEERILNIFQGAIAAKYSAAPGGPADSTATASSTTNVTATPIVLPDRGGTEVGGFEIGPSKEKPLGTELQQDPIQKYQLAAALIQEVAQLNRMVEFAAARGAYEPYVVRLQITSMPLVRRQPYDVYATMSFFPKEGTDVPLVIPLLVTDNIEGSLQSRSARAIRELAASLSLAFSTFGVDAQAKSLKDNFEAVLATEQNSLFTIGRVNDNTVKVRLGAPFNPQSEYAMVPRTHTVSLVLLVPRKTLGLTGNPAEIDIAYSSSFHHATKRIELQENTPVERFAQAVALMKRVCGYPANENDKEGITYLVNFAIMDDYKEFVKEAVEQQYCSNPETARFLWIGLLEIAQQTKFATARFEVPRPQGISFPSDSYGIRKTSQSGPATCRSTWEALPQPEPENDQSDPALLATEYSDAPITYILSDDGHSRMTVNLGRGERVDSRRMAVSLIAATAKGRLSMAGILARTAGSDELTAVFPSLAKAGVETFSSYGSYVRLVYSPPRWQQSKSPDYYVLCGLQRVAANQQNDSGETHPLKFDFDPAAVVAVDDGTKTEIRLFQSTGLRASLVSAVLTVKYYESEIPLPSKDFVISANTGLATLTFDSVCKVQGPQIRDPKDSSVTIFPRILSFTVYRKPDSEEFVQGGRQGQLTLEDLKYVTTDPNCKAKP